MASLIKTFFFKMSRKLVLRRSAGSERAETNYPEQVEKDLDDNYAAAISGDVWTAAILLAQQRIKTSLITFRMFAHQHSTHSGHRHGGFHQRSPHKQENGHYIYQKHRFSPFTD